MYIGQGREIWREQGSKREREINRGVDTESDRER